MIWRDVNLCYNIVHIDIQIQFYKINPITSKTSFQINQFQIQMFLNFHNRNSFFIIVILLCFAVKIENITIQLVYPKEENKEQTTDNIIYNKQGILQRRYNEQIFDDSMTCKCGFLRILQFKRASDNPSEIQKIIFNVTNKNLSQVKVSISVSPNNEPQPTVYSIDSVNQTITLNNNCPEYPEDYNYYNKVKVNIFDNQENHTFSFLIDCDFKERHKAFELGYLLITVLNAAIIIGVALHSRVWSIRYKDKPLCMELKWYRFVIIMVAILVLFLGMYLLAGDQFEQANTLLTYLGLVAALFFSFICADQLFFLYRPLRKPLLTKYKYARICDLLSFILAFVLFIIGIFVQNWIYNNFLAVLICVGAIKMLYFSSLKQAMISMGISVFIITVVASVLHFMLDRSYNDYASQIRSPLFILFPDLVDNLYKKCSWLPVIDIIVPAVLLSYLRGYDENYSTGWGGVYTVIGNLSFLAGSVLWIALQKLYPFSIPFSLVSYVFLSVAIFVLCWKRNQFKTLWQGRFNGPHNQLSQAFIPRDSMESSSRKSFGKMVTQDLIDSIKFRQTEDDNNETKKQEQNL